MRTCLTLCLLAASGITLAETPSQIRQAYAAEAMTVDKSFSASARRGENLFRQRFSSNDKMPSCTTCHTDNPAATGKHAITGKDIKPLAPQANGERFSDPAKVEKWFGRNCKEVIGRVCTPAEKADFVAYVSEVR
jgi:hypothetical protein